MDWMVVNSMQVHNLFASLGVQVGDEYQVGGDCLKTLDEILVKLSVEDRTFRTFRRSLGFTQVIKKDLLPLIISVYDPKVVEATLKILVNLTIPVECLLSVDVMSKTDAGCQVIFELNQLLIAAKDAFVDSRSTRAIMNYIRRILDKDERLSKNDCENVNNCLLLLRNILHIPEARVVGSAVSVHCSKQNQILWNLFTQSMDKVLIQLMTSVHKAYWGVVMVQLIALMYKDQHVGTLQKLLNIWFEASLSESSEDNESNTSPPDQGSGDSSPMLMSDPTSDSSDNCSSLKDMLPHHGSKMDIECKTPPSDILMGKQHVSWNDTLVECSKTNTKGGNVVQRKVQVSCNTSRTKSGNKKQNDADEIHSQVNTSHCSHNYRSWSSDINSSKKREFPSSSDMSDCGYVTQMENQESISTSSNEDEGPRGNRFEKPVHQKPHSMQKTRYSSKASMLDKKDLRRKKLVKRSKNSRMNMKALLHHTPTDEDISNLLKEFTVDFLLKGYSSLVQELHHQLLSSNQNMQIDTSHFFWLVIYFLKFAAQLELELEQIKPVLSFEILSYLTYEGVNLCEQLEIAIKQTGSDLRPYLRRMHLVVTAIREFIQTVDTYKKITHLSKEDRDHLIQLHLHIGATEDLKCLFVLLLRHYNPAYQSKQYLQDLIVTNHILLLFLDKVVNLPEYEDNLDLMDHIKQFATVEVMRQYGLLLEDFQNNGEFVNDCIFTMMHHIGGDLDKTAVLFQPSILKSFSHIWEADFEICDDWSDLIEYIIHKFINTPKVSKISSESLQDDGAPLAILAAASEKPKSEFSKEETDSLYWYYVQSAKCADVVGKIMELYAENGVMHLTRLGIIQELFKQDIINRRTYDAFLQVETAKSRSPKENETTEENMIDQVNGTTGDSRKLIKSTDKIEILREHLIKEDKGVFLVWLQKLLLQACSVKLACEKQVTSHKRTTLEPVPYHFTLLKQSIPIVPWNSEQSMILCHQPFILLLHKLGFHLPADSGKMFVRIPDFWTVDFLYSTARKLGPIDPAMVKFDVSILNNNDEVETSPETSTSLSKQNTSCIFGIPRPKQTSSMIRFTPLPQSTPNWMDIVSRSKCTTSLQPPSFMTSAESENKAAAQNGGISEVLLPHVEKDECGVDGSISVGAMPLDVSDQHSVCSAETLADSVSSDLTRMCVSDGDDKADDIDEDCPSDNKHMDIS